MPKLSERVGTFTDSVIRRMTRISDEYNAIGRRGKALKAAEHLLRAAIADSGLY